MFFEKDSDKPFYRAAKRTVPHTCLFVKDGMVGPVAEWEHGHYLVVLEAFVGGLVSDEIDCLDNLLFSGSLVEVFDG